MGEPQWTCKFIVERLAFIQGSPVWEDLTGKMEVLLIPLLFLAILAPASEAPITVTGHSWAPFISPMGEPFRARSAADDTLANWFNQADRNHDGVITSSEMIADAERFFATLDTNHDGMIDPDELAHYEWEIAPDIQVTSRTKRAPGQPAAALPDPSADDWIDHRSRRERTAEDDTTLGIGGALQGAARYGLLNMPEPVAAADTNFDRAISLEEFKEAAMERFQLLDAAHQGKLTLPQLQALRSSILGDGRHAKRKDNSPDRRIGEPLPSGP